MGGPTVGPVMGPVMGGPSDGPRLWAGPVKGAGHITRRKY